MVEDIAELGRLDGALQALEDLVGSPSLRIDHKRLLETEVSRFFAAALALLDGFFCQFCGEITALWLICSGYSERLIQSLIFWSDHYW